jgi:glycerate kinase
LLRALDRGARTLLVGIGGSATNDGGAGMASALGARFLDDSGKELPDGGAALARLARIDISGMDDRVTSAKIVVASDVDNPLTGADGASAIYGPQKGADKAMVEQLDAALARLADVVEAEVGRSLREQPGAGAAGGLGFGLMAFCNAEIKPGIDVALDAVGADDALDPAELVVTAEGRLDSQTLSGKVPVGVARRARRLGVPVVAIGGAVEPMDERLLERFYDAGICAICSSMEEPASEDALMDPDVTRARLARASERMARLLRIGNRIETRT